MFVSSITNLRLANKHTHDSSLVKGKNSSLLQKITSFHGTSAGAPLKTLKVVRDAYFGETMINHDAFQKEVKILETKPTLLLATKSLRKFKFSMQKIESNIYEGFASLMADFPDLEYGNVLKMWYSQAIKQLEQEELNVLDRISWFARDLTEITASAIKEKMTKCKQIILDNDPDNKFKRKTLLNSLDDIKPQDREEVALHNLKLIANQLPASNTSESAFIVKYADRSHNEIAQRLIYASLQTIEHVKPDSKGGENSLDNFILASYAANGLRGNLSLPDFIYLYPQVAHNPQLNIDDIINYIHKGFLKGHETYPYKIAETLKEESEGLIQIDLSNYHISLNEAIELENKYKWHKK